MCPTEIALGNSTRFALMIETPFGDLRSSCKFSVHLFQSSNMSTTFKVFLRGVAKPVSIPALGYKVEYRVFGRDSRVIVFRGTEGTVAVFDCASVIGIIDPVSETPFTPYTGNVSK